jgi:hypothetical protein
LCPTDFQNQNHNLSKPSKIGEEFDYPNIFVAAMLNKHFAQILCEANLCLRNKSVFKRIFSCIAPVGDEENWAKTKQALQNKKIVRNFWIFIHLEFLW